jgi:hypothetical protein
MSDRGAVAFKPLFPAHHIPVILLSLLRAGATLRKKVDNELEDRITNRLFRTLVRMPKFRDGPLGIHLRSEIPPGEETPGSEIDLLVACGRGYEIYFAIEAKRLRVCSTGGRVTYPGSSQYVQEEMMRFVSGQYAPHMRAGAMLGYVFDGQIDKARSSVDRSIPNKAKLLKMKLPGGLTRSTILAEMPIDETGHDLVERLFTIYHVLVAV